MGNAHDRNLAVYLGGMADRERDLHLGSAAMGAFA